MTPKLADYIAEGKNLSADEREIAALALQQIGDAEQVPGTEHPLAPDGVMDLIWFQGRLVLPGADPRSLVVETRPGETAARHDLSERSLRRLSNALFGYGPRR